MSIATMRPFLPGVLFLVFFSPRPLEASLCAEARPSLEHAAEADLVFSGRVLRRTNPADQARVHGSGDAVRYLFSVERRWKGTVAETVTVLSGRGEFERDEAYLVFAVERHGRLQALACPRARTMAEAGPVVSILERLPAKGSPTRVDRAIVAWFAEASRSPSESVQVAAIESLARIKKRPHRSVAALWNVFRHGSSRTRPAALAALVAFHDSPRSVRLLKRAFRDPDPDVRSRALSLLSQFLRGSPQAWASEFHAGLRDSSPRVRTAAIRHVKEQDLDPSRAVRYLLTSMADPSWEVRSSSAGSLRHYPGCGAPCDSALARAMTDTNCYVREAALGSILETGAEDRVQNAFEMGMEDSAEENRRSAFSLALERYDGKAEAIPIFIRALEDSSESIRISTMDRLCRASSDALCSNRPLALPLDMRPKLVTAMAACAAPGTRRPEIRPGALEVLANLGEIERRLSLFLIAARDEDPSVRRAARSALDRHGMEDKK